MVCAREREREHNRSKPFFGAESVGQADDCALYSSASSRCPRRAVGERRGLFRVRLDGRVQAEQIPRRGEGGDPLRWRCR